MRLSWKNLALLLLAAGLGCAVAYHWIGSSVDSQGVLREPFALIPLTWLFIALGLAAALVAALRAWRAAGRREP